MRKSYWQDWVLIVSMFTVTCIAMTFLAAVSGCESAPQPVSNYPVVMVFTAKWCPNCPNVVELNELAEDFPGVMILPVDVDENPVLVAKYGVKRIPRYFLCTDETCSTTYNMAELRSWLGKLQ